MSGRLHWSHPHKRSGGTLRTVLVVAVTVVPQQDPLARTARRAAASGPVAEPSWDAPAAVPLTDTVAFSPWPANASLIGASSSNRSDATSGVAGSLLDPRPVRRPVVDLAQGGEAVRAL